MSKHVCCLCLKTFHADDDDDSALPKPARLLPTVLGSDFRNFLRKSYEKVTKNLRKSLKNTYDHNLAILS